MKFKKLTQEHKGLFMEIWDSKDMSRPDKVNLLSEEFDIKSRSVYYWAGKIEDEIKEIRKSLDPVNRTGEYIEFLTTGKSEEDQMIQDCIDDEVPNMKEFEDKINQDNLDTIQNLSDELVYLNKKNKSLNKSLTNVRHENNGFRRMQRVIDKSDHFKDEILKAFNKRLEHFEIPKIQPVRTIKKNIPKEGLCCIFSDIHFDDFVEKEVVPSGAYNYVIAEKRLDYFVDRIINNHSQSEILTVYALGDFLKGVIWGGDSQGEEGLVESIVKAVEIFHGIFAKLSNHFSLVNVLWSNDNHSRLGDNVATYNKSQDYNYLLFKMLDMMLLQTNSNNVNMKFTKSGYHFNRINGHKIVSFHGDTLRSYKVYSDSECSKLQDICYQMFNERYDTALSGHLHRFAVSSNSTGYNICNGTSVGDTEYGTSSGFRSIQALQTILFIDEKSRLEEITPVHLSHIDS